MLLLDHFFYPYQIMYDFIPRFAFLDSRFSRMGSVIGITTDDDKSCKRVVVVCEGFLLFSRGGSNLDFSRRVQG